MSTPKIFYYATDIDRPSGGEKDTYQHVDILNQNGFEAYALHQHSSYRHTWFRNNTRTICFRDLWEIYDRRQDYFVLPETVGPMADTFPGRKVIFNKNLYYGFQAFQDDEQFYKTCTDSSIAAIFTVSEHNRSHLAFAFPALRILRVVYHIDCDLFSYRHISQKRPVIACVAKDPSQLDMLRKLIFTRNRAGLNTAAEYKWLLLEGYNEDDMAALLGEALLVISLSTKEGLSRTMQEAMACGCLVLVPGAGAAKECMPQHAHVEPENMIALVTRIENIMSTFLQNPGQLAGLSEENRRSAMAFNYERSRDHLVKAWNEILA